MHVMVPLHEKTSSFATVEGGYTCTLYIRIYIHIITIPSPFIVYNIHIYSYISTLMGEMVHATGPKINTNVLGCGTSSDLLYVRSSTALHSTFTIQPAGWQWSIH